MIIDHIEVAISNYEQSKAFYSKVLPPLNLKPICEIGGWADLGKNQRAGFWFGPDDQVQNSMHIVFSADPRGQVDQFYKATIQAGAKCNGKSGLRPIYHAHYYDAFVIDLDGHNIEVVCHQQPSEKNQCRR